MAIEVGGGAAAVVAVVVLSLRIFKLRLGAAIASTF